MGQFLIFAHNNKDRQSHQNITTSKAGGFLS